MAVRLFVNSMACASGESARVRRSVRAILAVRTTLLTFCSSYSQSSLYGATRHIDPGEPMKASPFAGALAIVLVSFARAHKVLVSANPTRHKS
jgi:hypothetical protein